MRLIAAGVCVAGAGGPAGPAWGQDSGGYPPLYWAAQEEWQPHALAHDVGVAIEHWLEQGTPDKHWVYATGFVTEMDGDTVLGQRVATFKYDAAFVDLEEFEPPEAEAKAFFPPVGTPLVQGDFHQARAMTLDPATGDIYVAGFGRRPQGTDSDYLIIKYDKALNQKWTQYYNGPVNGSDVAADISLVIENDVLFVVVTGTSPGDGTGLDIATIALDPVDGAYDEDSWPDVGWGDGVRRYDNEEENADDRAIAVAADALVEIEAPPFLYAIVTGTSDGENGTDYTTHLWAGPGDEIIWDARYDNGGADVAKGMKYVEPMIYVTGYSAASTTSFGPTLPNYDYMTLAYELVLSSTEEPEPAWSHRFDYAGHPDEPHDIFVQAPGGTPTRWVWVTGEGGEASNDKDVATVRYQETNGSLDNIWSDGWSTSLQERGYAITVFEGDPYITGARTSGVSSLPMLTLMYFDDYPPDYTPGWWRTYSGGSASRGAAIVVAPVDGSNRSVFVTGATLVSGKGFQFTTWRYRE